MSLPEPPPTIGTRVRVHGVRFFGPIPWTHNEARLARAASGEPETAEGIVITGWRGLIVVSVPPRDASERPSVIVATEYSALPEADPAP